MSTALRGWHPGEVNIQRKLSFDSPMAMAWSWISADMPEEHRMFYTQHLPFVPVTTLDARGRPWGSILASKNGTPGFMRSPMETVLQIEAQTWEGDPWTDNLGNWLEGEKGKFLLAGIGIEFGTRRRNKFAGWMTDIRENGEKGYSLSLEVNQAIGFASFIFLFLLSTDGRLLSEIAQNTSIFETWCRTRTLTLRSSTGNIISTMASVFRRISSPLSKRLTLSSSRRPTQRSRRTRHGFLRMLV